MVASTKPYKVKIFVDTRLATTVRVRDDIELRNLLPDLLVRCTRKGRGTVATTAYKNERIEEVYFENAKREKSYRRPAGFLSITVEARCPQSAP